MKAHEFIASGYHTSDGHPKDACQICGKHQAAHNVSAQRPVAIDHGGKIHEFSSVEEARKAGFQL